ncbi:MAG TPA: Ldh family oxidoreductase [Devosia sp.]
MTDTIHLSLAELATLLGDILQRHGCSPAVAACIANNYATAEQDGAKSHGVFRMPAVVSTLKSGWLDGMAEPLVEDTAPGLVRVDAANGFTQFALAAGRDLLVEKVRASGIAAIAIRNSHHFGALWPDVEPFAREGLIALSVVNSMTSVVPHGGTKPVYGTNPIAFASPRDGHDPLVFDQASSALANGDVQIAAREGHALPPGAGLDRSGQPTTDPPAVLDGGARLPFGGHKGSSIALMVEILCAGLTGGQFSFEVDWSGHNGALTPKTGQTIILIDPEQGASRPFRSRVEQLLAQLHAAGQERLPGDRRYANRRHAQAHGIALSRQEYDTLSAL